MLKGEEVGHTEDKSSRPRSECVIDSEVQGSGGEEERGYDGATGYK